jgi:hypothetical protein
MTTEAIFLFTHCARKPTIASRLLHNERTSWSISLHLHPCLRNGIEFIGVTVIREVNRQGSLFETSVGVCKNNPLARTKDVDPR